MSMTRRISGGASGVVSRKGGRRRLAAILAISLAAWALSGRDASDPLRAAEGGRGADEARALVEEQAQVARRSLRLIEKAWEIGAPVDFPAQQFHAWSRRLLEAQIFLSLGEGEVEGRTEDVEVYLARAKGGPNLTRMGAFEEHFRRMKMLEGRFRPLYERKQFSAFDFATVEYHRLQAQTWLARENGRNP